MRFSGRVTGALLEPTVAEVRSVVAARRPRFALFDTRDVESYSPDVRGPGSDLLRTLREAGLERALAVAPSAAVRMIGSALALATGTPLSFVESVDAAYARFAELRR